MIVYASGQSMIADQPSYRDAIKRSFAVDRLLRQHGWEIASRPTGGEPVWQHPKGRVVLPQSEVIKTVSWQRLKDAILEEELTSEGLE